MFGKLFGAKPAAATKPAAVNPQDAITKLNEQCDTVEKRIRVLETRSKDLKATAIQKKKAKD